jgi:hypothetical protein
MEKDPNKLFKAYSKLKAIKSNLNSSSRYTHERYVDEYNDAVSDIEDVLNEELDTFSVPSYEIKPKVTSRSASSGARYSSDKWTETQYLMTKVDALINYMEILLSSKEPKKPFGFSA